MTCVAAQSETPERHRPAVSYALAPARAETEAKTLPDTLPLLVFQEFLHRLHDGPAQAAAALRVGLAVWAHAVERGDMAQARDMQRMLYDELASLAQTLTVLQETGWRWAGGHRATPDERRRTEESAAAWDLACARGARQDGRTR